jgi:hypothetical protein
MRRSASVLIALLLLSVPALANLVVTVPAGQGAWYTGVTATEASGAFWDNKSKDGANCNVGYWLQAASWPLSCSTSSAGTNGPQTPLDYFASTGSSSTPVGWLFSPTGQQNLTLRVEVAGLASTNEFGWYQADSSGNIVGGLNTLFGGPAVPTNNQTVTTFNTTQNFGFYLCKGGTVAGACSAGNLFLSGTSYSSSDGTSGKFALFSQNPVHPNSSSSINTYWIGVEDTAGSDPTEGWGDFNDMIIRATVVPEPGFYGLMALGLSGLAVAIRRRKVQA